MITMTGQEDTCIVLPIQFVNRLHDTNSAGQETEELQLFAAVLVVGARSGTHKHTFKAYILFKLIELDSKAPDSNVPATITARFGLTHHMKALSL